MLTAAEICVFTAFSVRGGFIRRFCLIHLRHDYCKERSSEPMVSSYRGIDRVFRIDARSILHVQSQFDALAKTLSCARKQNFDVAQIFAGRHRHEGHATNTELEKNLGQVP